MAAAWGRSVPSTRAAGGRGRGGAAAPAEEGWRDLYS
jgi:hypothetical protein